MFKIFYNGVLFDLISDGLAAVCKAQEYSMLYPDVTFDVCECGRIHTATYLNGKEIEE